MVEVFKKLKNRRRKRGH